MRVSSALLLALPVLSLAQEQVPLADKLKGWFNKATEKASEYVPTSVPTPKSPVDAGAAKVAEYTVKKLNNNNWRQELQVSPDAPKGHPETWMIFLTGNSTCLNGCGNATREWNKAVALMAPLPDRPRLGTANCDEASKLCGSWNSGVPTIWHIQLPNPLEDQSKPEVPVRKIRLNRVNVTASEIVALHVDKKFENWEPYTGVFHPFNGAMHELGLAVPYATAMKAWGGIPQWVPMLVVSFISRSFMGRRQQPGRAAGTGGAPPSGAGS